MDEKGLGRDVTGHVIFSTPCHLIAPCVVAPGSLTITSTALFFTVDEDDADYQKLDPKVRYICSFSLPRPLSFTLP